MKKSADRTQRRAKHPQRLPARSPTQDVSRSGPSDGGEGTGGGSTGNGAPYVPGDELSIVVRGHWLTGGMLEISSMVNPGSLFISPPAPWSVLAILMQAAIGSQSSHWFYSHVETRMLADWLRAIRRYSSTLRRTRFTSW